MSLSRRNPRRDANEKAICEALSAVGATIYRLSGSGVPDLLIGFQGAWYAAEIKTAKGKRTARQAGQPYPTIRTINEALTMIGVKA